MWGRQHPGFTSTGCSCSKCGSNWSPKYGRFRGKQGYRCQQCPCLFTLDAERSHHPEWVKNLALAIYAGSDSIEAIGRVLG